MGGEDRYECGVTDYRRWAIARRRFLDRADDVDLRPDRMPPEGVAESQRSGRFQLGFDGDVNVG